MFIGSINKLNYEITSYKTRHSCYGNPTGCMPGTRVRILADLEAWAADDLSSKVYWLVGKAGTGKSTILHTLCEVLDGKNMLGGSFFCSRGSENARNARLIIPTIAHSLASTSPCIKSEIVKAIENNPKLAEPTSINLVHQFNKLIHGPIQMLVRNAVKTYKIIVIDAVDECTDLNLVSSLIQFVLESSSAIPLKVFIASRDEPLIRRAFTSLPRLRSTFYLHEVDKDVAKGDIRMYLETSLAEIKADHGHTLDTWPPQSEISALLDRYGTLFIDAATAIRYISQGGPLYESCLSTMANQDIKLGSKLPTLTIDGLNEDILDQACELKEESEVIPLRQPMSMIAFLENPLPTQAISSLPEIDAHLCLSLLTSVIHVSTDEEAAVTPFHTLFPNFTTNPTCCSHKHDPPFYVLVASKGHEMLALKCLEQMSCSLKYNICEVSEELTVSCRGRTNSPDRGEISEALKYSCLYWVSLFFEAWLSGIDLFDVLDMFLHKHFLYWIECLSKLGEMQKGMQSLKRVAIALFHVKGKTCVKCLTLSQCLLKPTNIQCHNLQLLTDGGCQCLQMNSACIQKHSIEIYEFALVLIPKISLIHNIYATGIRQISRVTLGLFNLCSLRELYIQNGSIVTSVAFSLNGSQVVSGLDDKTVQIWNVTMGEVDDGLKGHRDEVTSTVFSWDGSQVVSRSDDNTVQVWNMTTVKAELKGHMGIMSVVFAHDGRQVFSGSCNETIWIWNAATGEIVGIKAVLKGQTFWLASVDGSKVVSLLHDRRVQIWNMTMGELEAELKGHMEWVTSFVLVQDSSQVVSGLFYGTLQIWNVTMGVEAVWKGHINLVMFVQFTQDSSQVGSGLVDEIVQIWNRTTGQAVLKDHMSTVVSVVIAQDGSQVVFDWIWNMKLVEMKGHTDRVMSIVFNQDDSRVISKSHVNTVWIQNMMTGEVKVEMVCQMGLETSVASVHDGSQVVSRSYDDTVHILNVMSGEVKMVQEGHMSSVMSVVFAQDGSQAVSRSYDNTAWIWNIVMMGEVEAWLKSHTGSVTSIAFSQDGSQVVSGLDDGTVRSGTVTDKLQSMTSIALPSHFLMAA